MINLTGKTPSQIGDAAAAYLASDDVSAILEQVQAFVTAGVASNHPMAQSLGYVASVLSNAVPLAKAVSTPPTPTLAGLKVAKGAAVQAAFDARIAAGLAIDGLHVQIDDGARGNLIGLVAMAGLVAQGTTTWPDGYSRGWVTMEGTRIPLPTPADGVQLALAASAYYSGLVQHAQDLATAIATAADETALAAVDITAGWPSA